MQVENPKDSTKIQENFIHQRTPSKEQKNKTTKWKKIRINHISDKGLVIQ